jgi:hypothetical protein
VRSSTPWSVRLPVAPTSFPVPAMVDEVAAKAPVATSNVPASSAVRVALLTVNTIVPWNDATVPEKPVILEEPAQRRDLARSVPGLLVGSPRLLDVRCRSVEQMRLVNELCRLVEMAAA